MIGLVLEGGGVKGSYQAGVYLAFLECGVKIDGVSGTSIGAINASVIASGHGEDLVDIWLQTNIGRTFGFSDDFVESWLNKEINLANITIIAKEIIEIVKNKGISFSGLRNLIRENINMEELKTSPIDFGLVTVRARDFKPLYLWKEDIPLEKLEDYIIASASLPIFKMERMIDDNYYLDGGFYDNGPVNMMLERGYKTIYLVKVQGIGFERKYPVDADVRVIESKRKLGHILELDTNQVKENVLMGYYDALRVLKGYDGYAYVFKPREEEFFIKLNKNNKLFRRVKNFFNTKNSKDTTIKALEYVMEKENVPYAEIYDVKKVLKSLKKKLNKEHFIYQYVKSLKYFF